MQLRGKFVNCSRCGKPVQAPDKTPGYSPIFTLRYDPISGKCKDFMAGNQQEDAGQSDRAPGKGDQDEYCHSAPKILSRISCVIRAPYAFIAWFFKGTKRHIIAVKVKTSSVYAAFSRFLRKGRVGVRRYVKLGDLRLSYTLLSTPRLLAESKLVYAYLFLHRQDASGVTIPALSDRLGIPQGLTRQTLNELEHKKHIRSITDRPISDPTQELYQYSVTDLKRYGMLDLENE
jgi:hypothetical protein